MKAAFQARTRVGVSNLNMDFIEYSATSDTFDVFSIMEELFMAPVRINDLTQFMCNKLTLDEKRLLLELLDPRSMPYIILYEPWYEMNKTRRFLQNEPFRIDVTPNGYVEYDPDYPGCPIVDYGKNQRKGRRSTTKHRGSRRVHPYK